MWTPTPAPGTKRCRPCASWRPWGALTGANEVSADLLGLPDEEFFMGWYVPPTTPAPGTKRCRPCASWRPWGALTWANEVLAGLLGLPDEEFFIGWYETTTTLAPGTKRCRSGASWRPCGALTEENGVTVDFLGLYLKISMPERSCLELSAQDELHDLLEMIWTISLGQSAWFIWCAWHSITNCTKCSMWPG